MRLGPAVATLACGACLFVAGCGDDGGQPSDASKPTTTASPVATPVRTELDVRIDITNFKFAPRAVTIAAGASVTWSNSDKAVHSAENGGEKGPAQFDTGRLDKGDRKSIRFDKAGVYTYYCVYHRFMEATVTVAK